MAAAAIMMRREAEREQERKRVSSDEHRRDVLMAHSAIKEFDTDGNGFLDVKSGELTNFLTKVNGGSAPSDRALTAVVKHCAKRRASTTGIAVNPDDPLPDKLTQGEIAGALVYWQGFIAHEERINKQFKRYDVNRDGEMNKAELKKLMRSMTNHPKRLVTDEEIEYVLDAAVSGAVGHFIECKKCQDFSASSVGPVPDLSEHCTPEWTDPGGWKCDPECYQRARDTVKPEELQRGLGKWFMKQQREMEKKSAMCSIL